MEHYLNIVFRATLVYLSIIILLRLFGKKELAQLSVIDLVFILLLSNAVQNAMLGDDTSLEGGIIAASALFTVNFVLKFIINRNKKFSTFIQGEPVLLIYKGIVKTENLKKVQISLDELNAAVREHGVENIEDVDLAVFEVDGNISVLSNNFSKHTTKKHRFNKIISNTHS